MGSKTANIQKRKRLQALFERGRLVHFDANGVVPEPVPEGMSVWVGPPSPLQREQAIREASAARSRAILHARGEDDGSEINQTKAMLTAFTEEGVREFLIVSEETTRLQEARRRVLAEDEWEDFNALRDAMRQYEEAGYPETDEWVPLLARDRKFGEDIQKVADELRETDMDVLKMLPRVELEKRIIDRAVEQAGSASFMQAYDRNMLWFAVRDDAEHDVLFFENPEEIISLPQPVQDAIRVAYDEFITEAGEAKNLPRAVPGSALSAPSDEQAISEVFGPEESSV